MSVAPRAHWISVLCGPYAPQVGRAGSVSTYVEAMNGPDGTWENDTAAGLCNWFG